MLKFVKFCRKLPNFAKYGYYKPVNELVFVLNLVLKLMFNYLH